MKAANDIASTPGIVIHPDFAMIAEKMGVAEYEIAVLFAKHQETIKDILTDATNELLEEWIYGEDIVSLSDLE